MAIGPLNSVPNVKIALDDLQDLAFPGHASCLRGHHADSVARFGFHHSLQSSVHPPLYTSDPQVSKRRRKGRTLGMSTPTLRVDEAVRRVLDQEDGRAQMTRSRFGETLKSIASAGIHSVRDRTALSGGHGTRPRALLGP